MKLNIEGGERGRRFEALVNLKGCYQQHRVFVAKIGHGANGNHFGCRPNQRRCRNACRQFPSELGGQSRVTGIAPVSVPMGLMLQFKAQPNGLARRNALRRKGQQAGFDLLGLNHIGHLGIAQQLRWGLCLR